MANTTLNKLFVYVNTAEKAAEFKAKAGTKEPLDDKVKVGGTYYDKIVFLAPYNEIITRGTVFGLNNEADVSALSTIVGKPAVAAVGTEGETGYVAAQAATGLYKEIEDKFESIMGTGEIAEAYDTLKEIADWIQSDTSGAASLANRINTLEKSAGEKTDADSGVSVKVNTSAGAVSAVDVAVTGATVTYTAKSGDTPAGLSVTGNTGNVLTSASVGSIKNYIDAVASGEAELSSSLTESITVAGGPLADDAQDNWPSDWVDGENKVIPAGTSFEDIFKKLFLAVKDGTISIQYTTWNPSISAPTAKLSVSGLSISGTVEVGTKATVTATPTSNVSNNSQSAILTATQGYFVGDSTTWNNVVNEQVIETKKGTTEGTATVSATFKAGSASATTVTDSAEVTIGEGTNTLSVSESGVTAKLATADFSDTTYYASDNTKKKLAASATLEDQTHTDIALTSSSSVSVTGSRFMFWGGTTETPNSSAVIRALSNNANKKSSQVNGKTAISIYAKAGDTMLVIAAPKDTRGISSVLNVPASNAECASSFVKQSSTVNVEGANGFTAAAYDVWVYTADAAFSGGEEFKVTFSK